MKTNKITDCGNKSIGLDRILGNYKRVIYFKL